MKDRELRVMAGAVRFERREDDAPGSIGTLSGYAALFRSPSVDLGGFVEEIEPGAFKDTVGADDIRALVDHESHLILGRNRSGTLELHEDETGLAMSIALPDTSMGRDIAVSVGRGDVFGCSFSFQTIEDDWHMVDGMPRRTLKKVRLYDVGPVTFPAYPDTSVAVRCLAKFSPAPLANEGWRMRASHQRQRHARAQ